MNRLWSFLGSLIREAKSAAQYKDDLHRYVSLRYSEHEADQVLDNMKRMPVKSFQEYIDREYLDSGMNAIVRDMISAGVSRHPDRSGQGGQALGKVPLRRTNPTGASTDKGSGRPDPIPTRPDRSGVDSPLYSRPPSFPSGQKPTHAVGTAGQNQPKAQPSQGTGVVPQRPGPGETRSGLVQAQRIVDRLTKQGKTREADELAQRLQVPTSAERIVRDADDQPVVDPTGNPRIAVWSPDRIFKYRDADRGPGAPSSERQPRNRVDLIKHGLLKRQGAGVIKPNFSGQFFGQAWQPHGRSQVKNTMRPDPATGNFAFGKTDVDPSKTGTAVVWDGEDWIPKDEFDRRYGGSDSKGVANRAWRASQHPPTRGKHSGGSPVSTTSPESIPLRQRRGEEPAEEPNEFDDAPDTDPDLKPYRGG